VPGGIYNLLAVVDGAEAVAERLETNNLKWRTIRVGSDLKVTALVVPRDAGAGGSIDVKDTTKNMPFGGAAPATETWFYLSADAVFDPGDVYLGKRAVGALARGASEVRITTLAVPADTVPARYYVLAVADGGEAASEGNETNNVKARPTTVVIPSGRR
jgi:subtilase family serine protease